MAPTKRKKCISKWENESHMDRDNKAKGMLRFARVNKVTSASLGYHYKLPLSRSVLPESRPFEVTTLWRGKGGWGRESERCAIVVGKMRESTCDPLRLWHWRKAYRRFLYLQPPYVPGSSLLQTWIYDQWTLDRAEGNSSSLQLICCGVKLHAEGTYA